MPVAVPLPEAPPATRNDWEILPPLRIVHGRDGTGLADSPAQEVSIAVVTASLPTRGRLLAECVASIHAQTLKPTAHLIGVDYARVGTSAIRNHLSMTATGAEWIAILDDDDVADPNHLKSLYGTSAGADIIYSYCRVIGRQDWNPNRPFDPEALIRENYIPATALIRRDLIRRLGGWRHSTWVEHGWEDWDFWKRALALEARFRCVPWVTWTYRFHDGSKTYLGEQGAF